MSVERRVRLARMYVEAMIDGEGNKSIEIAGKNAPLTAGSP